MVPHWEYQDGEVPEYHACEECGMTLRTDRLDLRMEHDCVCLGTSADARAQAICDLDLAHYIHRGR